MNGLILVVVALLLLVSAFISAAESAAFTVGPSRLRTLLEEGFRGAETLQRVRSDVRDKSLNALRQLIDEVDSGRFPGLYLLITGTPAFFDGSQRPMATAMPNNSPSLM
jgi:hypothetical protein